MIQKIKGTMDIFPEETRLFRHMEAIMREEAEKYGFGEIRTPIFENTELFVRGVGNTTDVVQKEMYTFKDRDEDRSISLRPEGTAGVARAILEHGRYADTMPLRYYYIGSFFRHEAPQAGRSREFFQFGAEMYGAVTPAADASVISLAASVLRRLGLKNVKLHLNSIGCKNCRPAYREALVSYFSSHERELCDTCRRRLLTNPLRILDCKSPICHKIAADAPKTVEHLCPDCQSHFAELKETLSAMQIPFSVNPSIVRGLDYYTRTVFEFISEGIAAQSTLCGGGRYDGLIEEIGGPALSGIGFGMGLTRVILALEQEGVAPPLAKAPRLYIASLGKSAAKAASEITERLRQSGIYAECDLVGRSLKAQMKYANKLCADYTLILGDTEIESGRAFLRDMKNSTQEEVDINSFTLG